MAQFVYILLCDNRKFYVGITDDLERRLGQHRRGYSPYTKQFSIIELVYSEKYSSRAKAEFREKQIKGWSIAKKKALISGDKGLLVKLSKSTGLNEVLSDQ
jgi:predicted GIY-YIG superfamily endonuclease